MRRAVRFTGILVAVLALVFAQYLILPKAYAGTLTTTSLVELGSTNSTSYTNPMIKSDAQFFGIGFKTVGAIASSATIQITFPGSFTVGVTGGQAANTTDPVSLKACNAADGIFGASYSTLSGLSATSSGQTITITTSSALAATTSYCLFDTDAVAITNPSSAGTYNVTIGTYNGGSLVDQQTVGVAVLGTGANCSFPGSQDCNAYTVSATINPTFTMTLGASSDALGTLSSGAATHSTTGVTTTISTNAASGWIVWASDANTGLTSATAGHTIPSTTPLNTAFDFTSHTGSDSYGLGVVPGTGATTAAPYVYSGGTCAGGDFCGAGISSSAFFKIASDGSPASSDSFTTHELADISPTSPPGSDYADTITLIGCGSF